jgi:hypothetical protein
VSAVWLTHCFELMNFWQSLDVQSLTTKQTRDRFILGDFEELQMKLAT